MENKREIKVSEVIALLDAGKSREEIGTELDLTRAEVSALFKHPSLKGKKAKKQLNFVITDDTSDVTLENQENEETLTGELQGDLQEEEEQTENTETVSPWENSADVSLWEN